jgi:rhamnose utilization protein RhaD (predicted bifunctional aldolase and dehydrogenase)
MSEFNNLRHLSAEIGSNPHLVQGAGGNTSIKSGGVMWIKASGTWLKDAKKNDIFVPLDLAGLGSALERDDPACESCTNFIRADLNDNLLRPSIETSVHGLLPQKVVVHVHCVSTIARAICRDAEQGLEPILKDFSWSWIPYARPGLQLSRAIRTHLKSDSDVLILGNHGLAVAAENVASCARLLEAVTAVLRLPARKVSAPDLNYLKAVAANTDYHLPNDPECHAAALDTLAFTKGTQKVYYPDHVVFLGTSLPSSAKSDSPAIAIADKGVLIHNTAKAAIEPMVRCIGDVFRRVPENLDLNALTVDQIDALLNWDAEKYRQNMKA